MSLHKCVTGEILMSRAPLVLRYLFVESHVQTDLISACCCTSTQISASVSILQIHEECANARVNTTGSRSKSIACEGTTVYVAQAKQELPLSMLCIVMTGIICFNSK